jgi:hypothetical protein
MVLHYELHSLLKLHHLQQNSQKLPPWPSASAAIGTHLLAVVDSVALVLLPPLLLWKKQASTTEGEQQTKSMKKRCFKYGIKIAWYGLNMEKPSYLSRLFCF